MRSIGSNLLLIDIEILKRELMQGGCQPACRIGGLYRIKLYSTVVQNSLLIKSFYSRWISTYTF